MTFKDLSVIIILICLSVFLTHYIGDQDYTEAVHNSYFMSMGAILSWVYSWDIFKEDNTNE